MTIEQKIEAAVKEAFGVELKKPGRGQKVSEARFAARGLMHAHTGLSRPKLGLIFKCDQSNVTHSLARFKEICEVDPGYRKKVALAEILIATPPINPMHQPI